MTTRPPGTPNTHVPVAILGAGLTGLSAGFHLAEAGVAYRIFERQEHVGGHAITIEDEGYRFDRTGHLLHLKNPDNRARVLSWMPEDSMVEIDRRSMIFSHGVYTRYPFQANTFGLPPAVAYACLQGFLDAHFRADKPAPQNFEEFCLLHFGEGISRHFMIPYNARLWGVSPREITADWCARFVPIPKLEDVVAGAVGLNDRELGYNAKFLYPRRGIGELTNALAARVPGVELSRAPKHIDVAARELHFEDEIVRYDVLVSSAPLPNLVALMPGVPAPVRSAAARLRCTHLWYLDVALRTPCKKTLHWVYVPEEKYPFYRVGCYSNFSSAMAPPGCGGLYVELADRAEPNLEALLPRVADGLVEMGFIESPGDIAFARKRRLEHVYVVFDHQYFASMDAIFPFLDGANVISTGRYGGWNYSAMEDALDFGRNAAHRAIAILGGTR